MDFDYCTVFTAHRAYYNSHTIRLRSADGPAIKQNKEKVESGSWSGALVGALSPACETRQDEIGPQQGLWIGSRLGEVGYLNQFAAACDVPERRGPLLASAKKYSPGLLKSVHHFSSTFC